MIDKDFANIVEVIAKGYKEVMDGNRSLNQVSSYWIKQNPDWNEMSRGFYAETLMEVVRWNRFLEVCIHNTFDINNNDSYRLRVLTYLLVKCNDARVGDFFSKSIQENIIKYYQQLQTDSAIIESIPDWLYKLGKSELGDLWETEIRALNTIPPIVLRVNTLKVSKGDLIKELSTEGFKITNLNHPDALMLTKRADIFKSKAFFEGHFEIQDASSQEVAPFLQVEPGMRIVDACAGNGGKTLHIASLMRNKGKILALDNADWKLEELMKRSVRAGVSIIETRPITTTKVVKRLKDKADRLLLDVPCSGLGVLRRNPDSKWRLTLAKIEEIKTLQIYILDKYTQMVKPGGKFVYSTCSILPSENQQQIQSFLSRTSGAFILEEEKIISPSESGFDGFYMARLKRVL
jgi:16S rRNA (cytosine967-C5)-methyltransferase